MVIFRQSSHSFSFGSDVIQDSYFACIHYHPANQRLYEGAPSFIPSHPRYRSATSSPPSPHVSPRHQAITSAGSAVRHAVNSAALWRHSADDAGASGAPQVSRCLRQPTWPTVCAPPAARAGRASKPGHRRPICGVRVAGVGPRRRVGGVMTSAPPRVLLVPTDGRGMMPPPQLFGQRTANEKPAELRADSGGQGKVTARHTVKTEHGKYQLSYLVMGGNTRQSFRWG